MYCEYVPTSKTRDVRARRPADRSRRRPRRERWRPRRPSALARPCSAAGFRGARELRARKNRRQGRETDENRTDARVRRTRARDCCARRRVRRRFTVFSIHLFIIYVSVLFSARTRRGSVTQQLGPITTGGERTTRVSDVVRRSACNETQRRETVCVGRERARSRRSNSERTRWREASGTLRKTLLFVFEIRIFAGVADTRTKSERVSVGTRRSREVVIIVPIEIENDSDKDLRRTVFAMYKTLRNALDTRVSAPFNRDYTACSVDMTRTTVETVVPSVYFVLIESHLADLRRKTNFVFCI